MTTLTEPLTLDNLRTVPDIKSVMSKLGLPPVSDRGLIAVGKVMGADFKQFLIDVANQKENARQSTNAIKLSICLLSPAVAHGLAQLNLELPEPEFLVRLGVTQGLAIRENLNVALSADKENAERAKGWLKMTLSDAKIQGRDTSESGRDEKIDSRAPSASHGASAVAGQGTNSRTGQAQDNSYSHVDDDEVDSNVQDFRSVHFYGKQFALCFSASMTKASGKKKGVPTINLDAAAALPNGERNFGWKEGIHFQFTPRELPAVLSVLLGNRQSVEFKSHGQAHDKGFAIERQDGQFYAKCFAKDMGSRGVPIPAHEAFYLVTLIVDQLRAALDGYSVESILNITRATNAVIQPRA